jgi:hypothetical protein
MPIDNCGGKNPMFGRKHTEETKRKIAESRKNYRMEKHPSWIGGRRLNHNGYVQIRIPEHHRAVNGYVFEHIVVAEEKIGRRLEPNEHVHHKDHNRTNNDPSNLEVIDIKEHAKLHSRPRKGKVVNCHICGSEVYRKPSHIKERNFCSLKCVGVWTYQNNMGVFKNDKQSGIDRKAN